MKWVLCAALLVIAVGERVHAARRVTPTPYGRMVEKGRARELAHRATTFGGSAGSVTRFGRALGGGPRGFSTAGN